MSARSSQLKFHKKILKSSLSHGPTVDRNNPSDFEDEMTDRILINDESKILHTEEEEIRQNTLKEISTL